MKAVVLEELGRLEVRDVPEPDGRALRVRAAGINFLDVLIKRGLYPQMPDLPYVPGVEVAGEIDGRRVMALTRWNGGGYAERIAVEDDWLVDLPDGATFEEGAAFLMAFLTAWIPLRRAEGTVLVTAAAGGVGSAAVQVAKHVGAHVVAVASTEEKRRFALELGADEAAGYDELPACDWAFDTVGGDVFAACLKAVRPLGTAVAIGYAGGLSSPRSASHFVGAPKGWQDVSPTWLVGRNLTVQGFYLGRLMSLRPDVVRQAADELAALWREGAVRPVVGATFSLEHADEAQRLIEERRSVGKVVLVP